VQLSTREGKSNKIFVPNMQNPNSLNTLWFWEPEAFKTKFNSCNYVLPVLNPNKKDNNIRIYRNETLAFVILKLLDVFSYLHTNPSSVVNKNLSQQYDNINLIHPCPQSFLINSKVYKCFLPQRVRILLKSE